MSIKHLYEDERPTLLLDFANSKTLDPRITFTRNSTATYVDGQGVIKTAAAGEGRIDHDPATGDCRGLLIEEARTNNITSSQDFTASPWNSSYDGAMTVTNNQAIAPDGTMTAASVMEVANPGAHILYYGASINYSGAAASNSVYVKSNGRDYVGIKSVTGATGGRKIIVSLIDGSVTKSVASSGAGLLENVVVTNVGNGWWRISTTVSNTSGTIFPVYVEGSTQPDPTFTNASYHFEEYTGDATKGYYVWGAQSEQGSFGTSLIPTSGATVTRAQDFVTVPSANFIDPSQGTFVWDVTPISDNLTNKYAFMATDTGTNNFLISVGGNFYTFTVYDALSEEARIDYGSAYQTDTKVKAAAAYAINDVALATDGVIRGTDSNASMPATIDELYLFRRENNVTSSRMSGYFSKFSYYNTRLSNSTLEALTK